jgi:hypothetical protein
MDRLLSSTIDKEKITRKLVIVLLLFFLLPILLNTFVLIPINTSLESDVLYRGSVVSILVKYRQDFLDLCAFSSSYAMISFFTLLSPKQTKILVIFYTVTFLAQIPLKLIINAIIYGSFGNELQIVMDSVYLGVYFALQMLQLLVVYIFTRIDSDKFKAYVATLDSNKSRNEAQPTKILPFSKLLNWNNPLQRSAIKMSLLILLIKLVTRVINDISYGAPESVGEVLIMVLYYLSDIIYGAVAYLISIFVISQFYEKIKKKSGVDTPFSDNV